MSSFSENFQRDESKETQYDDSAFSTFALGMLLVGVLFFFVLIIRRLLYEKIYSGKQFKNCQCENCIQRLTEHNNKIRRKSINITFYFYTFLLIVLLYLSYLSYLEVKKDSSKIKKFDPYEILEIDPGIDEKQIKKAYKKLALKYHPDKNPNNLQAKAKFILITKAYEALTNEEAKENYRKWGNPDGPGSMRLSVALPSFILEKKNHMPILVIFVLFILVIFPAGFLMWYNSASSVNESGMMVKDEEIFYRVLNENILLKQMPFVLSQAMEYGSLTIRAEEADVLTKAYMKYKDLMPKHVLAGIPPANKKSCCLLYSFIHNAPLNYPHYQQDLEEVLRPADIFIQNMYKMAIDFTNLGNSLKPQDLKFFRNIKNFGYNCIRTIFEFSQNIHQKISHVHSSLSPFTQLPYITEERIKILARKNKKFFDKQTSFSDFLHMDKEKRNNLLQNGFGEEELKNINAAANAFPLYEAKIDVFVEGFEDILPGDVVTFKLTLIRTNLEEGKELGIKHSNSFPELFKEEVSFSLIKGEKTLMYQAVVEVQSRVTTHEFKNVFREPETIELKCELVPLCYKGLDQVIPFSFNVLKVSDKRKGQIEDIQKRITKIEPSFFQKMMSQVIPMPNDDDDEEEEEEQKEEKEEKKEEEEKHEKEE